MALGVNIISEFDSKGINKAIRDFKKLETAGEKTAFALKTVDAAAMKMGAALVKFGAVAVGIGAVIGKNLVDAASNLEESQSKVNVVFGSGAKAVTDFASTTAVSMGISKQAALEATGTYGNLIQAFGLGQDKAQTMSTTLVQLAGDLASFNNTSVEDAIQAIRSGLSGEAEPLKRFGVAINDVRMKTEAMNMGLYDGHGTLSVSAKMQAAYALILKDTTLAQGDYARTADGVANTQRTLAAQFQDVKAEIGTALIPAYKALLGFVQDNIIPVFREFARVLGEQGAGAAFKYLGGAIMDGIGDMGRFGNAILILVGIFGTIRLATIAYSTTVGLLSVLLPVFATSLKGVTVAQTQLNVAMYANPIGLIIAAVVALIAVLVLLYVKFEAVRNAVSFLGKILVGSVSWINNASDAHRKAAIAADLHTDAIGRMKGAYAVISMSAASTNDKLHKFFRDSETGALAMRLSLAKGDEEIKTSAGGAAAAVKSFKEKVKDYVEALKSRTKAERDVKSATDNVSKANVKAALTTDNLKIAQLEFNQIIAGFGIGSKQAKEKQIALEKAQRGVERAGYDVEASVYSVKDAEADLAKERLDPESSLQSIREKEIALAEAKLSTRDATDSQMDSTVALAEAERLYAEAVNGAKEGSDAFKEALAKVNDAKQAQVDAADEATDAYIRQADAVDSLAEAIEKLTELQKTTGAKAIAVAESQMPVIPTGATPATGSTPTAGAGSFDYSDPFNMKGLDFASFQDFAAFTIGDISATDTAVPQNVNVTVNAGLGMDSNKVVKELVDEFVKYGRSNGALPFRVST